VLDGAMIATPLRQRLTTLREPIALYSFALLVRACVAALFPAPGYPDSAYYVEVARSVAAGRGFSVDFLWTFIEVGGSIPGNPHLPVPSNPHWAPLASIVQVPSTWLLGPSSFAAFAPFVVIGALAAPLAWAIARDVGASRTVGLGAGFLGAVPAAATVFAAQPDNVSLTMVLGGGAMWLSARGMRGDGRAFAAAGVLVGLATLARADGLLLASGPAAAFAFDRWRARRGRRSPAISWRAAFACGGLFVLVVAPWYVRQIVVFGSLSPSASAGVLWLRSFADLNSVTADRSLDAFLAQGVVPIVAGRIAALLQACVVFGVIVCGVVLVPLVAFGGRVARRSSSAASAYLPWLVSSAVVVSVSVAFFAVHVPNGMFLHASVALAPHAYVLAMEGAAAMALALPTIVRRDPRRVERLAVLATCTVVAVIAAFAVVTTQSKWSERRALLAEVASALDNAGASAADRLMSADAAGLRYATGRGGIVSPDDNLAWIERAACAYDVRWLVLERSGAVGALAPLLDGASRPEWIGAPVATFPGDGTAAPVVEAALYPVVDSHCPAATAGGSVP
jgi:4-amino-4-deoxy-L-arabinose transferase-like glycosyltransferase